jgi:hypothetical protein
MATEPILTIDIDDSAFTSFVAKFEAYQRSVAATGARWREVSSAVSTTASSLGRAGGSLDASGARARALADAYGREAGALDSISDKWAAVARGGASMASHIGSVTAKLARWSVLTGAVSGLLGAGSLFGLASLASSAAASRTRALGLGVSQGQMQSFETAYRRIGVGEDVLAALAEAAQNPLKTRGLVSMGIDATGKDATTIFAELLPRIKAIADATPTATLEQAAGSMGLTPYGITGETLQILKNMSPGEVEAMLATYRRGAAPMGLSDDMLRKWTDLNAQLAEAGLVISSGFEARLVALTPVMERISAAAVAIVERGFKKDGLVDTAIESAARSLDWLAGKVGGPGFQTWISGFVKDCASVVKLVDKLAPFGAIVAAAIGGAAAGFMLGGTTGAVVGAATAAGLAALKSREQANPGERFGGPQAVAPFTDADRARAKELMDQGKSFAEAAAILADERAARGEQSTAPSGGSEHWSVRSGTVLGGVDPRLADVIREATKDLPPGWRAEAISGRRPGDPRYHGQGKAIDVQLYDAEGRALRNYQDARTFRAYEKFAQGVRLVQQRMYPDMPLRWGGYFSGPAGRYGALDTMHFDTGGTAMGGGSWEGGLTSAQRALWPGVESKGLSAREPVKINRGDIPMPAPLKDRTLSNYIGRGAPTPPSPSMRSPQAGPGGKPLSVFVHGNESALVTVMSKGRGALSR